MVTGVSGLCAVADVGGLDVGKLERLNVEESQTF